MHVPKSFGGQLAAAKEKLKLCTFCHLHSGTSIGAKKNLEKDPRLRSWDIAGYTGCDKKEDLQSFSLFSQQPFGILV